jgi:hypothetical protein
MAQDLMRYDLITQDALRGVVRLALTRVAKSGLPGDHHFYIAFNTRHPEVRLSERLRARYPQEMTIVLQHQFWGLDVLDDRFEVDLSFDNIAERLSVPFAALKGFVDPSVQFGLQFDVAVANPAAEPAEGARTGTESAAGHPSSSEPGAELPAVGGDTAAQPQADAPKVVKLDTFRKK